MTILTRIAFQKPVEAIFFFAKVPPLDARVISKDYVGFLVGMPIHILDISTEKLVLKAIYQRYAHRMGESKIKMRLERWFREEFEKYKQIDN